MTGPRSWLRLIGPGLLVAATGVGAGDLATGAFTGSALGTGVLWAVLVGAALKFVLSEGLARWQLATGETLLEGALLRLGWPVRWLFLLYFLLWSWFVGSALISASGATTHALLPVFDDPAHGKTVFGIALSLVGVVLVELGGYRLFEKVMEVAILVMFVTVVVTAAMLLPDLGALRGLVVPAIPDRPEAIGWTVALIGGVGGTLTVLCYGYWIREEGRVALADLGLCRADLAVGYAMTAVFGVAMVIIGSEVEISGRGADLLLTLSERLRQPIGEAGRWLFLLGAWGAVFSSLLGVWQAVPYVFADFVGIVRRGRGDVDTKGVAYRGYLYALATVPMLGLLLSFREVQKVYAVFGAAFLPLLAVVLLVLNGRADWVGAAARNRPVTILALGAIVAFFGYAGWLQVTGG